MGAKVHKSQMGRDWKEVYKAALFEDDTSKIPERIVEAERALAARALELFGAEGDEIREQQAMENAMYFLRMLGSIGATPSTVCENVNQTTHPHCKQNITGREILFVPDRGQDLHATSSTLPICNE